METATPNTSKKPVIEYSLTPSSEPDKDGLIDGTIEIGAKKFNVRYKAEDVIEGDFNKTLYNVCARTNDPKIDEFLNDEYSNEDPESVSCLEVIKLYTGKIDTSLLQNLLTDLKWFINNVSEVEQVEGDYYPTIDEIMKSLYETGKYEYANDRYKIAASLSLELKTYELMINPNFVPDEFYFSDMFQVHVMQLEEDSKSDIAISGVIKEIKISYPNNLKGSTTIN